MMMMWMMMMMMMMMIYSMKGAGCELSYSAANDLVFM